MEVSVLASGSSGNSFYIQSNGCGFLVDAGISCKQIVDRLSLIGKDISNVRGIFVTHEHVDHVRGLRVLTKKFKIPVYLSEGTKSGLKENFECDFKIIKAGQKINLGGCLIEPFEKSHDVDEPLSFSLSYDGKKVSVITDVGIVCNNVIDAVKDSDLLVLESNHDITMLEEGPYPYFLKQRILSDRGHLSNYDAALLVLEHASPKLKHIFLSHLSETNNDENVAFSTFSSMLRERKDMKKLNLCLTYRHKPTEIIRL